MAACVTQHDIADTRQAATTRTLFCH